MRQEGGSWMKLFFATKQATLNWCYLFSKFSVLLIATLHSSNASAFSFPSSLSTTGSSRTFTVTFSCPSGSLRFSNKIVNAGGGIDSVWVSKHKKPLYLGVQSSTGSVGIAVCEPGSCSHVGRFGTKGRVVQSK